MWMNDKLQEMRESLGMIYPKTVKQICMDLTGMTPGEGVSLQDIIHQAAPLVFDFTFPIQNEQHREFLEALIIKKYFFREICCEDVMEWQLRLDQRLNEIMPYYNKMYASFDYLTDILDDVDYTRTFNENNSKTGTENTSSSQNIKSAGNSNKIDNTKSTVETDDESINRFSDTPQGQLTGVMNDTYLTSAQRNTSDKSETATGNSMSVLQNNGTSDTSGTFDTDKAESGVRQYTEKVKGKMYAGSKAKMVMEYRKAVINIDMEIISRLSDLFMNVYHSYEVDVE